MKRQAGILGSESDDEEEYLDDDEGEDDNDIMQTVNNLNVFCVSAMEYLKLKKKLPKEDGEPQVRFQSVLFLIMCQRFLSTIDQISRIPLHTQCYTICYFVLAPSVSYIYAMALFLEFEMG